MLVLTRSQTLSEAPALMSRSSPVSPTSTAVNSWPSSFQMCASFEATTIEEFRTAHRKRSSAGGFRSWRVALIWYLICFRSARRFDLPKHPHLVRREDSAAKPQLLKSDRLTSPRFIKEQEVGTRRP